MQKWMIPITLIYLYALMQGIVFTLIPATATILVNPDAFHLSTVQYGMLFIPMILGAITSAVLGIAAGKHMGIKSTLLLGSLFNTIGLLLFVLTHFLVTKHTYSLLSAMTLFLGLGIGSSLYALNPFVTHFFSNQRRTALVTLHTALGMGMALSPLLINFFKSYFMWWIDPLVIAMLFIALFWVGFKYLPTVDLAEEEEVERPLVGLKSSLGNFLSIMLLYGFIETTLGNWSTIFLHNQRALSSSEANVALATFWAALSLGRIATKPLSIVLPPKLIYQTLPILILIGAIALSFADTSSFAIGAMCLAGLGCSALFPLTLDFAQSRLPQPASIVYAVLIALYLLGYGIAAAGLGAAQTTFGISLSIIYLLLIIPILMLALICYKKI